MEELWDIYDINRKKTGKVCRREIDTLNSGEYHIVVSAVIMNSKNEILISQRAKHKKHPLKWECCSGSIIKGETSLTGMLRELKEELGIELTSEYGILLKELRRDKVPPDFKDIWLFKKDIDLSTLHFTDGEVVDAKWINKEDFIRMKSSGEFVPGVNDIDLADYDKAINIKIDKSATFIGKNVEVIIDRPLGSVHPKYDDFIYPINYGYVSSTKSGDGEELDCYILGVDKPLNTFSGKCIAVIHRLNDNDDKLIVVPKGMDFTDEQIKQYTDFQEKYFESIILRK